MRDVKLVVLMEFEQQWSQEPQSDNRDGACWWRLRRSRKENPRSRFQQQMAKRAG
ncbi:hypothetical protein DPMN_041129 [Dreissena polymorpha]|uniref:Uncharacterized protein n=1 Tax=Dreissena polymorpha TaxID=45954 RepID=A0A9D4CX90_DREPO|nr:hypothetical protein DPMN_041129 [Dreissena polymorpha]